MAAVTVTVEELAGRVRRLSASRPGRTMLGLVGAPGAGKSTLAVALAGRLADLGAVVVPFDGFHLANATLAGLGLLDRKGALETFDVDGYAALLERLREARGTVYAPAYERSIEEAIAGAVTVPDSSRLVITEGNYLLIDHPAALRARRCLDEVWFIDLDDATRVRRLVERHVTFGKSGDAARAWTLGTDQRNADLVSATRGRADLVVRVVGDVIDTDGDAPGTFSTD